MRACLISEFISFRRTRRISGIAAGLAASLALGAVSAVSPAAAQTTIPSDVDMTCPVSAAEFNGWFASGTGSEGGLVKPADSLTFDDATVCDFYRWSAQMFLWITSPTPDGSVLDSPVFFTISPENAQGQRTFIPNGTEQPLLFAVRSTKEDEENDEATTGRDEDVGEVGQAGSDGVLMSQYPSAKPSIVYYGVHSNDVYAYFRTGVADGKLSMTDYPNTPDELTDVENFAQNFNGTSFPDSNALTMELKTSWVDVEAVGDPSQYLLVEADVPSYTPNADNTVWTLNPNTETRQLALIGVHIVATVLNHPEMVWATFEHVSTTPAATYSYTAADKSTKTVDFNGTGNWLFYQTAAQDTGENVQCMKLDDSTGDIVLFTNKDGSTNCSEISATNTIQQYPWGSEPDSTDADVVANNTLLLSTNSSVQPQLQSLGDIRANYLQIGGIWTSGGVIPEQKGYNVNLLRGSLSLVNSTMETYVGGTNCFSCHSVSETDANSFGLSHVFDDIEPLAQ